MASDAATLIASASCYACHTSSKYDLELLKLALLRDILLTSNPDADVSPQTLLESAKCYACYSPSVYALELLVVTLLKLIFQEGGAGGLQRVFFGSFGDPNGNQSAKGDAIYYDANGSVWAHYTHATSNTDWSEIISA